MSSVAIAVLAKLTPYLPTPRPPPADRPRVAEFAKRIADLQRAVPGDDRPIALGQPHGTPQLARRHAAKPVVGLRRPPSGQRSFVAVEAAHPRVMHRNLRPWKPILPLVLPQR